MKLNHLPLILYHFFLKHWHKRKGRYQTEIFEHHHNKLKHYKGIGDNMIKKLLDLLTTKKERVEFDETIHKLCEECGGGGIDFVAGPCMECDGNGFVNKTRSEVWQEKIKVL